MVNVLSNKRDVGPLLTVVSCLLFLLFLVQCNDSHFISSVRYFENVDINLEVVIKDIFTPSFKVPSFRLTFAAFRRNFSLMVRPVRQTILSPNLEVTVFDGKEHVINLTASDIESAFQMVEGKVEGDEASQVTGSIANRTFLGVLVTSNVTYNVQTVKGTQVIFRDFDVSLNEHWLKCNHSHDFLNSTIRTDGSPRPSRPQPIRGQFAPTEGRHKIVCTLKLFADHTFFQDYSDRTIVSVIQTMVTLVDAVDKIFMATKFEFLNQAIKTRLQVVKMDVSTGVNSGTYRFTEDSTTSLKFLSDFSGYYFADVCLAIAFVARKFTDSIIGLSYPYEMDVLLPGGICEQRTALLGQGEESSFNVAVVTLLSPRGEPLPHEINIMNLAHQIGHSFGSNHDDPEDRICSPTDQQGHFIMSEQTATGLEPNNLKYSDCSRRQMAEVMLLLGPVCFLEQHPVCGNGIKEQGEKCDCGSAQMCQMVDSCCTPELLMEDYLGCQFIKGADCSPRESYCCSENCKIASAYMRKDCTKGNECLMPAICPGNDTNCLPPKYKAEGTLCEEGRGRCREGVCMDVACGLIGLQPCKCRPTEDICQLCCMKNRLCLPYVRWGSPVDRRHYFRPNGEQCLQGQGVCVNGHCRLGFSQQFVNYEEEFESPDVPPLEKHVKPSPYPLIFICLGCVVGAAILIFFVVVAILWLLGYNVFRNSRTAELAAARFVPGRCECRF